MIDITGGPSEIDIPISLLEAPSLTPTDKLVWTVLAIDDYMGVMKRSQEELAGRIGLCRQTVSKSIERLTAFHLYNAATGVRLSSMPEPQVKVATSLILNTSLKTRARLIYMLLQVQTDACNDVLISKYAPLSDSIYMGVKSVRKAVKHLAQEKWVDIKQDTRVKPILIKICNPVRSFFEDMKASIVKQLNRGQFLGETIVRVVSSLFVDTKYCEDDSSPGYLENPSTGERLQFDRSYPLHKVAIEFNGLQHYRATDLYDEDYVQSQRVRDAIKRDICDREGIELLVIHPHDLSLATLFAKLQQLKNKLPLRNLLGADMLLNYLELVCKRYRDSCPDASLYC